MLQVGNTVSSLAAGWAVTEGFGQGGSECSVVAVWSLADRSTSGLCARSQGPDQAELVTAALGQRSPGSGLRALAWGQLAAPLQKLRQPLEFSGSQLPLP